MKRILSVLLIIVMAASLLSACGGTQAPTQPEGPGASVAPQTGSSGKPTISIAIWGDENRKKTFEELFVAFEEANNCDVVVNLVAYQDYATKLATQLAAGNAPDVVCLADGMEAQFCRAATWWTYPLMSRVMLTTIIRTYTSQPWQHYRRRCRLRYSILLGPRVIYVNKTLFDKAGVKSPSEYVAEGNWTYETMYDLARQMTDISKGQYGLKLWDTSSATNYVYAFYDLVLAYGADYFNQDTTDFTLNTPEGIAAVQAVYDAIYKDQSHLKPGDATEFTAGTIAMARSTFSYAKTIKGSNVDFEWEVVPVPKGPAANAPVVTGLHTTA